MQTLTRCRDGVILSLSAVVSNHAFDDWPQWRGLKRDGISAERGLLKDWPAGGPPLAWRADRRRHRLLVVLCRPRPDLYPWRARRHGVPDGVRRRHRKEGLGDRARPAIQQ